MKDTILEPARELPVVLDVDLCVVGGSCTGVFAAVRAARLGLRAAIVEKQNCFGGVATAGLVNVWHSLYDTEGKIPIIGGLTREVLDRLHKRSAVEEGDRPSTAFRLNTEELKIELDELVVENKIVPFLHTFYTAPVCDGNTVKAVIVENKNGRQAIRARQFVDATGDGILARHLNVPFVEASSFQPPTLCTKLAGMQSLAGFNWSAAVSRYGAEYGLKKDWGWGGPIPGLSDIQMRADGHVFDLNTANADQLTEAEIAGRRQVRATLDLIRDYGPAESSLALVQLAAEIGVRETCRIEAAYRLTGEDVLSGRRFEDAIANGSYPVDTHHADGPGITFLYLDGTKRMVPERGKPAQRGRWRDPLPEDPIFYQIPFRSLVPVQISNLITAGRMLDADKAAFSAVRVMVNLNQTGEAAGVASALALHQGCEISSLDPALLRQTLAEGGSIII